MIRNKEAILYHMSPNLKVNNGFEKSHDREFMIRRFTKITLESFSNLMDI